MKKSLKTLLFICVVASATLSFSQAFAAETKEKSKIQTNKKAPVSVAVPASAPAASVAAAQTPASIAVKEASVEKEVAAEQKNEQKAVVDEIKSKTSSPATSSSNISVSSVINSGNIDGLKLNSSVLSSIYSGNNNKAFFFGEGTKENQSKAIDLIKRAEEHGLNTEFFRTSKIKKIVSKADPKDYAKLDVMLTQLIVNFTDSVANGRAIPKGTTMETFIVKAHRISDFSGAFKKFINAQSAEEYAASISPKHANYRNLVLALREIIINKKNISNFKEIPYGADIKPNTKDYRVADIRKKLSMPRPINPNFDLNTYDSSTVEAVKFFQKKYGIKATGIVDRDTVDALNYKPKNIIAAIAANLERYRWLTDNLAEKRVEVNLPQYRLRGYKDGEEKLNMGVIIGRSEKKSPIMQTVMYELIFNPFWHVPSGYARKFLLPAIQADPNFLKVQDFAVSRYENGKSVKIANPEKINWNQYSETNFPFTLVQNAGRKNALGPVRFSIKNPLLIYLHGTAEPWLFDSDFRAQSAGCIRVQDTEALIDFLTEGGASLSESQMDALYNDFMSNEVPTKKQVPAQLKQQTPIYITYFTVSADEKGEIETVSDVYEWDQKLVTLIDAQERSKYLAN